MAELSPESAEAGIFKENNHNFGKGKESWLQKPAALTGKLEVMPLFCRLYSLQLQRVVGTCAMCVTVF